MCMAEQFHNCIEALTEDMLSDEALIEQWQAISHMTGNASGILVSFEDGSWYIRCGDAQRWYSISEDDDRLLHHLEMLQLVNKKLHADVMQLVFEEMTGLTLNSLEKRQ